VIEYLITSAKSSAEIINKAAILAARHSSLETLKYLVSVGAQVDTFGLSAIIHAIGNDHIEMVTYLVNTNVNINMDWDNCSPFIDAYSYASVRMVKHLVEAKADIAADARKAFQCAVRYDRYNIADYIRSLTIS
jgi:hypothetical protein